MLFIVAALPFVIIEKFLSVSAGWAFLSYGEGLTEAGSFMEVLFILLPSAIILAPTVVFFFNMAAEAHVFIQKK